MHSNGFNFMAIAYLKKHRPNGRYKYRPEPAFNQARSQNGIFLRGKQKLGGNGFAMIFERKKKFWWKEELILPPNWVKSKKKVFAELKHGFTQNRQA